MVKNLNPDEAAELVFNQLSNNHLKRPYLVALRELYKGQPEYANLVGNRLLNNAFLMTWIEENNPKSMSRLHEVLRRQFQIDIPNRNGNGRPELHFVEELGKLVLTQL